MLDKFLSNRTSWLWLLLFAILSILAGGRLNVPLAAWIAPVFGLRFIRQHKPVRGYIALVMAIYAAAVLGLRGTTFFAFVHPAAEYLFFGVLALIGALPYLADRILTARIRREELTPFWATLIFPFAVTAMDFLSTANGPWGTFGAQGYSQSGFLPIVQWVSVTGLWGLTWIISWFASVINYLWERDFERSRAQLGALVFGSVMGLFLIFGFGRIWLAPDPSDTVQVAGFTMGTSINEIMALADDENAFREATVNQHQVYLERSRQAARQGAQIVVWPEGAGLGFEGDVSALLEAGQQLAREEGIYLAMPTFTLYPDQDRQPENVLYIADPNGELALRHVKFGGSQFEGSLQGSGELQTLETPFGTLSGVICWDADFPTVINQASGQGVDLLLVPSNDWYALRDIHADMAVFRGVENGMAIVRQTSNGVSLVSDAYGRILSRVDGYESINEQFTSVPLGSNSTLYPMIGDAFGLLSVLGFALVTVGAVIVGRKTSRNVES